MITAFVERWCPKTHTFYMSWGECTITLQDVAYHFGLTLTESPLASAFVTSILVQQHGAQRREAFSLKLTWLRERVRQMPPDTDDPDTL
ncbi:uncharacterized protein DS421_17g583210 [Arachis hypogaea]|nr:uncharacterized protein DS421_17g583210 [Arachis hypogaea]